MLNGNFCKQAVETLIKCHILNFVLSVHLYPYFVYVSNEGSDKTAHSIFCAQCSSASELCACVCIMSLLKVTFKLSSRMQVLILFLV